MKKKSPRPKRATYTNPFLPPSASHELLDLLWQLELWLREMVYVELRARQADWETVIQGLFADWPPHAQRSDKRYRHMATRHQNAISYLSTGQLFRIISAPANWPLFEKYFSPKNVFDAKVEEISQIRNRVAHFRTPHKDDLARVAQLLRDLDHGLWKFCTTYFGDRGMLPRRVTDPVTKHFTRTHTKRRFVEMLPIGGTWSYAHDSGNPALGFYLKYSIRPWATLNPPSLVGQEGIIYHATFRALGQDRELFPLEAILEKTIPIHPNCIHIKLEGSDSLEISVPSILGKKAVCSTIEQFLDTCCSTVGAGIAIDDAAIDRLAEEWPEYVLPPYHPIGMLSNEMPCKMFTYRD